MFLGSCWVHIAWSYCGGETMVGNRGFDVFLLGGAWCRSKVQYILGVLAHLLRVGLLFCFGDWTHPKDYLRIWRLDGSNVFFWNCGGCQEDACRGWREKEKIMDKSVIWWWWCVIHSKVYKEWICIVLFCDSWTFSAMVFIDNHQKLNHLISLPENVLSFFFFE